MIRLLLLSGLLFAGAMLTAQTAAPLWSATVQLEVSTNAVHGPDHRNFQLLRRPQSAAVGQSDEYSFDSMGSKLVKAAIEGRMPIYKDPQLRQAYTSAEITDLFTSLDTVVVFNSETYEEMVTVTLYEADPADYDHLQLQIQLNYHPDGSIEQEVQYGSILIQPFDELGNRLENGPRAYFAVTTASRPLKFRRAKWNLIDQHMINFPLRTAELATSNQLATVDMVNQLMQTVINGRDDNFVGTLGDYQVLNSVDRQGLRGTVDTVVTYSPEDYSEHEEIVVNVYDPETINQMRLLQYWAWDEGRASLTVLPLGYALIMEVKDDYHNFLYDLPLFYHIVKRYRD